MPSVTRSPLLQPRPEQASSGAPAASSTLCSHTCCSFSQGSLSCFSPPHSPATHSSAVLQTPSCFCPFGLPKEFMAFSASLAPDILPSLPTHESSLDLASRPGLYSSGPPGTYICTSIVVLGSPCCWKLCNVCVCLLHRVSAGTILVHLCITHNIWNCAFGIRGDKKVVVVEFPC